MPSHTLLHTNLADIPRSLLSHHTHSQVSQLTACSLALTFMHKPSSDHLSPSLNTQEKPFQRPAGLQCLIQCFVALYPKAIMNSLGRTRRNPGQEFGVSPVTLNGHEHGFLTEDIFLMATLSLFAPLHHCWGLLTGRKIAVAV